jgi:hypothetical protein
MLRYLEYEKAIKSIEQLEWARISFCFILMQELAGLRQALIHKRDQI